MKQINISVPDEVFEQFGSEDSARAALEELLVVNAVRTHTLSRGQGARLMGKDLWTFDEILARHDVPTLDLSDDEVREQARPLRTHPDPE